MPRKKRFPIPFEWTPDELRKLRKHYRWRQKDVAELIGSASGSVSRWEQGGEIQLRFQIALDRVAAS